MDASSFSWLPTALILTPLGAAGIICALAAAKMGRPTLPRWIALASTAVSLLLALALCWQLEPHRVEPQLVTHRVWIAALAVEYFVGLDGLNVAFIVLTALMGCIACATSADIHDKPAAYFALLLLGQTGAFGALAAFDLFLFFFFWELAAIPLLFLIGLWGGPRREQAALKTLLVWLSGSLAMLLAIIALYRGTGELPQTFALANGDITHHTFNLVTLSQLGSAGAFGNAIAVGGMPWAHAVFLGLFVGFVVRLPAFPLHTWLADVHQQAPPAVKVMVAGVLTPLAAYGLLRCTWAILPEAAKWASPVVATLGVVNLVWGAVVCLAQSDLRRLLAYASVSQVGLVLLGIAAGTPQAASGALYQVCSHAVVMTWLVLLARALEERAGSSDLEGFGGLAHTMPEYAALAAVAWLALAGTPGLGIFIGEVLVLVGAWGAPASLGSGYALLALTAGAAGLILAACCLWTYQRLFMGPSNPIWGALRERPLSGRERALFYGLALGTLMLGVVPMPILQLVGPALQRLMSTVLLAPVG